MACGEIVSVCKCVEMTFAVRDAFECCRSDEFGRIRCEYGVDFRAHLRELACDGGGFEGRYAPRDAEEYALVI